MGRFMTRFRPYAIGLAGALAARYSRRIGGPFGRGRTTIRNRFRRRLRGRTTLVRRKRRFRRRRRTAFRRKRRYLKKAYRRGNLSKSYCMKRVHNLTFTFKWDETNNKAYYLMSDATGEGIDGNIRNLLPQYKSQVGSTVEAGYRDYQKVQNYETFRLLRMSTKLHDFRVFRRIETHVGVGQNATFHEDKAQFFDPEIGFFRNKGDGYPGALLEPGGNASNDCGELMQWKCMRSCKGGFWWSTNPPKRLYPKTRDCLSLKNLIGGGADENIAQFFEKCGWDCPEVDSSSFDHLHSCDFKLAMKNPVFNSKDFYMDAANKAKRKVVDYVQCTLTHYTRVKFYRRVQ